MDTIIVDTRERALIELLPECSTKTLAVADIWIGISPDSEHPEHPTIAPGGILIERKTISDLEASIFDKRYREQRTRLLSYAAEHSARVLYIIEGRLAVARPRARLGYSALSKHLTRLTMRYGVSVLSTETTEETAILVKIIADQLVEDPKCFQGETVSYTDVISQHKKVNKEDPNNFLSACLQQCSGVSSRVADALMVVYGVGTGFTKIMTASEEELSAFMVTGAGDAGKQRKLGIVGVRLYKMLHGEKIVAKKLIHNDTATLISTNLEWKALDK